MKHFIIATFLVFGFSFDSKSDELLSSHTIGHITGGLGSIFLGPLPGLGLAILPEAIKIISSEEDFIDNRKTFYVNEYSKEFKIEPLITSDDQAITSYSNTVKLTNSIVYQ